MEFRHLRSFVAAAEIEHFRRAADLLRLPQPAVSRHIKSLEKDLKTTLFERAGRRMRLSAAGKLFLEDARRILHDVAHAQERARSIARGQAGTLRIACNEPASGDSHVLETIRSFRAAMPAIALDLIVMDSLPQTDAVRSGQVDAGFLYRNARDGADLDYHQMAKDDELLLAVPKSHPLSRRSVVNFRDLREEPLIFLSRSISPAFYDMLIHSCMNGGLVPRIVQEARSATMVLNLVSAGLGLGFVSSAMRGRLNEGIVLRKVPNLHIPIYFDLIWRKANPYPVLTRFLDHALALTKARDR